MYKGQSKVVKKAKLVCTFYLTEDKYFQVFTSFVLKIAQIERLFLSYVTCGHNVIDPETTENSQLKK